VGEVAHLRRAAMIEHAVTPRVLLLNQSGRHLFCDFYPPHHDEMDSQIIHQCCDSPQGACGGSRKATGTTTASGSRVG